MVVGCLVPWQGEADPGKDGDDDLRIGNGDLPSWTY